MNYKKEDLIVKNGRVYNGSERIYTFTDKKTVTVQRLSIIDDAIILEGAYKDTSHALGTELVCMMGEDLHTVSIYKSKTGKDVPDAEHMSVMRYFLAKIPLECELGIRFGVKLNEGIVWLNPEFTKDVDLNNAYEYSIYQCGDYIVRYNGESIILYKDSWLKRKRLLEDEYKEIERRVGVEAAASRLRYHKRIKNAYNSRLKKQVVFISNRTDGEMLADLKVIYDKLDLPKKCYLKRPPYTDEDICDAAEALSDSKVVVTDSYSYYLRLLGKKKNQKIIQLWHAAGAYKKFGVDGYCGSPIIEQSYHQGYDLVAVSADSIVEVYANAFGIDRDKVQAIGVPRTDRFYNDEYITWRSGETYSKHPYLNNKQIILYAPTFRQCEKGDRLFPRGIDYDKLNSAIAENQVFVICPHPSVKESILEKEYENIKVIRESTTEDMMFVADLLITDYSSVIFDYSLLNKPMAFYCDDLDTYKRDFYLDPNLDLPGAVFTTQDDLIKYISEGNYIISDRLREFRGRYMSACDGRSADRVIGIIKDMIRS